MATRRDKPQARPVSAAFAHIAQWTSRQCGRPSTFILACAVIVIWGASGPVFHYSDTWQLIINTGTTIITFLMVFLIQNTQNRDMTALHLKLDELISVNRMARNKLLTLEDMTEEELERLKGRFSQLADELPAQAPPREEVDESAAPADVAVQGEQTAHAPSRADRVSHDESSAAYF